MKIIIVTPAPPRSQSGNRLTAVRYARILRDLGCRVRVATEWNAEPCDLLIALHARKSFRSIAAFKAASPRVPVCLVLTGTDLYDDIRHDHDAQAALALADRVVVLQPEGLRELARTVQAKTSVIFQSAHAPSTRSENSSRTFDVCVLGHLRTVKDPFRAAEAARLLPASSRIRIVHVGKALEDVMQARARAEAAANPRYHWLGEKSHSEALRVLHESRAFVQSSQAEGGSSALAEALVASIPVLASRIPAAVGMLEPDHPGFFEFGDTAGLARMLARCEIDADFRAALVAAGERSAPRFDPAHEHEAWRELLRSLIAHDEEHVAG